MPDFTDIVIIGAGAAGIAAARALVRAGREVRVLEARGRAGGRAFTRLAGGRALDMGCGWLHSADVNPLADLAREAGMLVDESPAPWQSERDDRIFPMEEHGQFRRTQTEFEERLAVAALSGADRAARELLEPGNIWNPLLGAISTYVNGVELERLSVTDVSRYHDSDTNHRIVEGLGACIADFAAGLPVTFNCPVRRIDHSGPKIRIDTEKGSLDCTQVAVTLPTKVISGGGFQFFPELRQHKSAAEHLPLGIANKIFFAVEQSERLPESQFLIAHHDRIKSGSYHLRPFGWPVIEGYFGGAFASELERAGSAAFADHAIGELCSVLGNEWRKRLTLIAASAWADDPFAQGSYSHALPGHADDRAVLAAPHMNRIFFAGEATSRHSFSTVSWREGKWRASGAGNIARVKIPPSLNARKRSSQQSSRLLNFSSRVCDQTHACVIGK